MAVGPPSVPLGTATPPQGPSAPGPAAQEGLLAQARIKYAQAVRLLTESLGVLKDHPKSDEFSAGVKALGILAPHTPEVAEGLGQSEIMAMLASLRSARPAGPGGPGPAGAGGPPHPMGAMAPRPAPQVLAGPPLRG